MKIIWDKVTWYSKLLAVILFVFVFIFAFKLGQEYQQIQHTRELLGLSENNLYQEKDLIKTTNLPDGKFCFYKKQEATVEEPYEVEESIVLNIQNNIITGEKTGIQKGPDMYNGYSGTLEGFYNNNELELTFAYEIEGSQGREIEIYKLENETLQKLRWPLSINDEGYLVPSRVGDPKIITYTKSNCEIENEKIKQKENILNSDFELAS